MAVAIAVAAGVIVGLLLGGFIAYLALCDAVGRGLRW